MYLQLLYKLLIAASLFVIIGCTDKEIKTNELVASGLPIKDSSISYAKRFSMAHTSEASLLFLYGNKEAKDTTSVFVLYKSEKPPVFKFSNCYYIKIPVESVASMSSVYSKMISKLNCEDKIVAIENADYYNDSFILDKVKQGKIKELSKGPEMNIEQTLLLNPGLILSFGMGNPSTDVNQKILQSKIPVAISLDHLEEHPLARAEWIKFVAAFFDKQKIADSLFTITENNYNQLKALTDSIKSKPTVLTEIKYADAWYVPGGRSFMAHLLSDAGSDYLWNDNDRTGSLPLTFEEVFATGGKADYWINLFININSKNDLKAFDERYALFAPYKNDKIYNNNNFSNSKGYSIYWESGMVNPDELLKDLIHVFHPSLLPQHELKYYKKIN